MIFWENFKSSRMLYGIKAFKGINDLLHFNYSTFSVMRSSFFPNNSVILYMVFVSRNGSGLCFLHTVYEVDSGSPRFYLENFQAGFPVGIGNGTSFC